VQYQHVNYSFDLTKLTRKEIILYKYLALYPSSIYFTHQKNYIDV